MKSIQFIIIILFSFVSFSQNYKDKLDEMIGYYDDADDNKYIAIANELLNNKYGKIDNETKFYCEYFLGYNLIIKEDYRKAIDKYKNLLSFSEKNNIDDSYGNIRKCIKDIKSKIKDLEILIADLPSDENIIKVPEINNDTLNKPIKKDGTSVTLTVTGTGKTIEEAKTNALRSAIEQTFGAFISSKTELLNDKVMADQIVSVANGNIKSFEMLNESHFPDGSWGVTLKAIVSVSKLSSFVEAKGIAIEIKGGMFALNIKQQILNEQGEIKAVSEMVGLLHEPMQISFDYVIKSSDPKSLDTESKNWEIPLVVTATTNKNIDFCANFCIKTLEALSLSPEEVLSYQSLNKAVFSVVIKYKGETKTIYLRKQSSVNALKTLTSNWIAYTRLFTVQSGMDESYGNGEGRIHVFSSSQNNDGYNRYYDNKSETINFLTTGQQAATFSWQDKRTLAQIENMTGYTVKPRGIVSQFKHGGFVVYEENGHGLIMSIFDFENVLYEDARVNSDNFILNGYYDWRLPILTELIAMYEKMYENKIGGLNLNGRCSYWSSEIINEDFIKCYNFCEKAEFGGRIKSNDKYDPKEMNVRPVRSF